MIVVGLIATEGTPGMIEASTTRRPSIPLTAPCEWTTAHDLLRTAHRRRPGRVPVVELVGDLIDECRCVGHEPIVLIGGRATMG
jgi:hypothetical protein